MGGCIPPKILPPKRRNLPWLSKGIVQAMHRRNALFKRAKRSGNDIDYAKYSRVRNKVVRNLRSAKHTYFHELKPSNHKKFWKAVKCLHKNSSSIPVLTHNNITYETDQDKADALNSYFISCFNNAVAPLRVLEEDVPTSQNVPDILCAEEEVAQMLRLLDTTKANGRDGISACML